MLRGVTIAAALLACAGAIWAWRVALRDPMADLRHAFTGERSPDPDLCSACWRMREDAVHDPARIRPAYLTRA